MGLEEDLPGGLQIVAKSWLPIPFDARPVGQDVLIVVPAGETPDGTNEVQTFAEGVDVLPDGSVLVTGFMEGNATFASFDPAGPKVTLSSTVNASGETTRDVFLARYDRDGRLLYATLNRGNAREGGVGRARCRPRRMNSSTASSLSTAFSSP